MKYASGHSNAVPRILRELREIERHRAGRGGEQALCLLPQHPRLYPQQAETGRRCAVRRQTGHGDDRSARLRLFCRGKKHGGKNASCRANAVSTINLGVALRRFGIIEHNNKLYITRATTLAANNLLDVVDLANNNSVSTITLNAGAAGRSEIIIHNNKLYIPCLASNLLDVVDLSNNAVSTINLGVATERNGIIEHNNKLYVPRSQDAAVSNLLDVVTLPPSGN